MSEIVHLDARGLKCPLPVLKARKTLLGMAPGAVLRVVATDPMARIDLPHFCGEAGHFLLNEKAHPEAGWTFDIQRGPDR